MVMWLSIPIVSSFVISSLVHSMFAAETFKEDGILEKVINMASGVEQGMQLHRNLISSFDESCSYFGRANGDFACSCDRKTLTIECESDLVCNKATKDTVCATFSIYTKFQTNLFGLSQVESAEICISYSPVSGQIYQDGCVLLESVTGNGISGCKMAFENGASHQIPCEACSVCNTADGAIGFQIDCSNVAKRASTSRCEYVDAEKDFFPGFSTWTSAASQRQIEFKATLIAIAAMALL